MEFTFVELGPVFDVIVGCRCTAKDSLVELPQPLGWRWWSKDQFLELWARVVVVGKECSCDVFFKLDILESHLGSLLFGSCGGDFCVILGVSCPRVRKRRKHIASSLFILFLNSSNQLNTEMEGAKSLDYKYPRDVRKSYSSGDIV